MPIIVITNYQLHNQAFISLLGQVFFLLMLPLHFFPYHLPTSTNYPLLTLETSCKDLGTFPSLMQILGCWRGALTTPNPGSR